MNVGPVNTSLTGIERQAPEKKVHAAPPPPSAASGSAPNAEIAKTQNSPVPLLIPEHEVKVQLDTPEDGIEIYQVLDKQSGNLVLQVPSAEQLRGIHQTQELLQEIASRGKVSTSDAASTPVVKGEGNNNGSKL
jgi:hypothetical protein